MPQPSNHLEFRPYAKLYLGVAGVLAVFIASGMVSYSNIRTLRRHAELVAQTHETLSALSELVSAAKDAETGQRGYIITGDERYLQPYHRAVIRIGDLLGTIESLIANNPDQSVHLSPLKAAVAEKLRELEDSIHIRQQDGFEAARKVVVSDRGKDAMDQIRERVEAMQQEERSLRAQRVLERDRAYEGAVVTGLITGLLGIGISIAIAYLLRQGIIARHRQDWLAAGQIKLAQAIAGDQRVDQLGDNILKFLAEYLDAYAAALYVQEAGSFRRIATYGIPNEVLPPERVAPGDGLVGQAVKDRRPFIVRDVPAGYLTVGSALGQTKPAQLMIAPAIDEGHANAVVELGFLRSLDDSAIELFRQVSDSIGVAIRSAKYRAHLQELIEETQRQSEELQAQSEELRVSNEELEEQSRALRESQARLENQQAELEQTNSQLEEQTQLLEAERDIVSRSKAALEMQAQELERASQYKSDFLANMSHELRTPLNSSLILAKLLADNPSGNLTAEQVQFAETIQTSGNDLLALINDILDLSKIEAGHMEIHPEPLRIQVLVDDLDRVFKPLAEHKQLKFQIHIAPGCPDVLETDRQRFEQVLKNLLSNAIKFTEQGQVELTISSAADHRLAFAVTDSGIGIPAHQQHIIFDAFQQADSTTSRKHGGTGLGLSISRELVALLGGDIHLASEPGRGSTFTVTVPQRYRAPAVRQRQPLAKLPPQSPSLPLAASAATTDAPATGAGTKSPPAVPHRRLDDDRGRLTGSSRVILAVEDDEPFAKILYRLAHELDFQCLLATSAEDGFATALQYLPSAVILDVGLPDHSGLWVLDRLKHDRRTRHIPVHVISAADYAQTALSLGAVGYMLKPVMREQIVDALKSLETRLDQRVGRVLIVEDDAVQLDSMRKLLSSQAIETVGAASAAECLERLKTTTFDCMVLDLSLPDASGFSLLETLSNEDTYSFPPVIVYTGRELSSDEEQRLRRYSKSIIIKGAKSPERLLDEVTLFLHQVVSELPAEQQRLLEKAKSRDAAIEGRRILIVEDDVRNVFALTSTLEPRGAVIQIARNGREALEALENTNTPTAPKIDLVLMDVMMPEMDGITAVREIRKHSQWKKLPIIMLTAKAMRDDQENCLAAGANDYMAKPLDVEKLLSLIRVWMPR